MYLHDNWYVAAFAEEVTRVPLRRTLLDESVVLYRTEASGAVALSDVCPHRRAPLHLGRLFGDVIACPYHGLRLMVRRPALEIAHLGSSLPLRDEQCDDCSQ